MEWRCKCGRIELDDRPGWGDWLHVPVLVKHLLPGEEEGDQPPPAPRLARQRWEPCLDRLCGSSSPPPLLRHGWRGMEGGHAEFRGRVGGSGLAHLVRVVVVWTRCWLVLLSRCCRSSSDEGSSLLLRIHHLRPRSRSLVLFLSE
jgi:hypothetical protein